MTGEAWDRDPAFMDFEEPSDPPKPPKAPKDDEPKKSLLPVVRLPEREKPITSSEVVRGVSLRAKACVNMRLEGASFVEIADVLEYETPADARRDCERALAATHPAEDWETLRQVATARAEKLFANSFAMAKADYLVTSDGTEVPNLEKRQWHAQAAADLMNHAAISGAKAPTKLEVTPGEAEMERLVEKLLTRGGYEVAKEADVLELSVLEDGDDDGEGGVYAERP